MDDMTSMKAFSQAIEIKSEHNWRAQTELVTQADVPTVALLDDMKDVQARLTKLEARDTRGLLGKLFGKGTVVALVLAVFLISGTAWAVELNVFGLGGESCGKWTAEKEKDTDLQVVFKGWLNGYLTAYAFWVEKGSGPVNETDVFGARAWVDNYCQDYPLDFVADAASALIYAIKAK